jgi:DNA mismatch repair protein MutS
MQKLTPLLKQYHKIKEKHEDAILLFRLGDFYETFYEDAKLTSTILNLTLTSRPCGKQNRVPLAGFPYKAAEVYIDKLVKAGQTIAICEQLGDTKSPRDLVYREVVEVITPGTVCREGLLDKRLNNYLMAISSDGDSFGLAFCDLSTGDFRLTELSSAKLLEEVERVDPKEILVPSSLELSLGGTIRSLDDYLFDPHMGYETLRKHFGMLSLEGFGCEDMKLALGASGAIFSYLKETQKRALSNITKLTPYSVDHFMWIDKTTRRNLELLERIRDSDPEDTLLEVLDRTNTGIGARELRRWILSPLLDVRSIRMRQRALAELLPADVRLPLEKVLSKLADIERLISRVALEKATPRDLVALKDSLILLPDIKGLLKRCHSVYLRNINSRIGEFRTTCELISSSIMDSPPAQTHEGGIIRPGFDAEVDRLKELASSGKSLIAKIEAKERARTGIASLKVGYNSIFGYYIEVTKPNLHLVPDDYIRKQTLVNAERFITQELKELEASVVGAEDRLKTLEHEIFCKLRREAGASTEKVQSSARAIGELDVVRSLALIAQENRWVEPIVDETNRIRIVDGRHPVVERIVPDGFVPNSCELNTTTQQILIITGPNMAGKSTYLRQIALIVILAQIGSYVPAREARIGVVDRIFTRIGASDDLARGVSTFLAEMNEAANILNNATPRSLILLDEIGRGTSTYDGLSIAWAVVEHLHNDPAVKARTLFATHYHQLTELECVLEGVKNYNVACKEVGDRIVFLRKVLPGASDRSYGVEVAKLAGLPGDVIERAQEILQNLEEDEFLLPGLPRLAKSKTKDVRSSQQLSIFPDPLLAFRKELSRIDPESLTPIDALNKLFELKKLLKPPK